MLIRKYLDPAVNEPVGGAAPIVEKKYSADNPPKSKEEWQTLAKDDPQTWISLTQANTDKMYREKRELEEKLGREQQEKLNLTAELNRFKQPPVNPDGTQQYSETNFPKTEAEWETLALEKPIFAMDLRNAYNARRTAISTDFNRAFSSAAQEVQGEHPDMYVQEVDASGNPIKDDKGKIVLRKDASGVPLFNPNSEKGKLWEQIYKESYRPDGTNALDSAPNAPRLMMAELERRLVKRGQAMIQSTEVRQNHIAAPGVPPPISTKVIFKSKEEESHAEKAIERGVYRSKEEYCQLRDGENSGYYEEGRRPDFSKK